VWFVARAFRALLARPGFTIVAIATLALGLGVNTAVFSLTRTVLLRPLPYRNADRLVQVNQTFVGRPGLGAVAPAYYLDGRERVTAFEETTFFRRGAVESRDARIGRRVPGARLRAAAAIPAFRAARATDSRLST
jgi:hypothetical protein